MKPRALFVNPSDPHCGVYQYGRNLFECVAFSGDVEWGYIEAESKDRLMTALECARYDYILYNWQAGIGGFMSDAPFRLKQKQILIYHDLHINESGWDLIFFSDPTMKDNGKWVSLGRPIPNRPLLSEASPVPMPRPIIGCHGFIGAWADQVVKKVIDEFQCGTVHLILPFARYGDADGAAAKTMAARCANMVKGTAISLCSNHDFLDPKDLWSRLAGNDLNCYIRPPDMRWRGVSSALDMALSVKRPIAINKSSAFRHLHDASPSICVEDASLLEIIGNGLSPLVRYYNEWSHESIRAKLEGALLRL